MAETNPVVAASDAFDQCEDCGGVFVAKKAHSCPVDPNQGGGKRTADHREWRQAQDDGNPNATVWIVGTGGGPKAYHRDDGGSPDARCVYRASVVGGEWRALSRADAKRRRCYPCSQCFEGVTARRSGGDSV